MAAYLEVWTPADQKFVTLAAGPAGREYRPLVQLSRLREAVISGWRDGRWRWLRLRCDPGQPAAAKPPGTS